MNILKIVNSYDGGGVLACEEQFIKQLKKNGCEVDAVIVGAGDKQTFYRELVNKHYSVPNLNENYAGNPLKILRSIWNTSRYGKYQAKSIAQSISTKYDAIIFQRPTLMHLAGRLSEELGVSSFWHMPGTVNSLFSKRVYTYFCSKYEITPMANSVYTCKTLGKICKNVIYPGFDEDRVMPNSTSYREMLNISSSDPVYGMIARVSYQKAQDILIEAFIKSNILQVGGHLILAGGAKDSSYMRHLENLSGLYLNKQIHFLGEIRDIPKFYSTIDVAVNSRRDAEAFGISVAEALGAAKPIIAYKLGGPSEMIDDNENGWLVQNPSVEDFCQKLNLSLLQKDQWKRLGEKGKLKAERFSVKNNVNKLIKLIENSKMQL